MRITKLELRNFKRFTHTTFDAIPATARLVLLVGSNGSGKSSVFDAFEALNKAKKGEPSSSERDYYRKNPDHDFDISLTTENAETFAVSGTQSPSKLFASLNFYGRSSFRQIPRLTRTALGAATFDAD
jgi:recombinational DNA repair ATPase RecF